jgi:hypothetical protein
LTQICQVVVVLLLCWPTMKSALSKILKNPCSDPSVADHSQITSCGMCGQSGTRVKFSAYFSFSCQFSFHQMLHFSCLPFLTVDLLSLSTDGLNLTARQTRDRTVNWRFVLNHKHLTWLDKHGESNSVALIRERPPLSGEVSANFCG